MKLAFLHDDKDELSPLWRALSLLAVDGKEERVGLEYGRASSLLDADAIIGRDFLRGEISVLSLIYPFVIDGEKIGLGDELINEFSLPPLKGRILGIGLCMPWFATCISSYGGDNVSAIHPLPFRDSSFDGVVIYELFDHDFTREAHRIIKKGGKLLLIFRDQLYGGVSPVIALKFVVKFSVTSVTFMDKHWIIEATRVK